MACHEIAALRLGLMRVLRLKDEAARQHEVTTSASFRLECGYFFMTKRLTP